jgi:hypothetical protein
VRDVFLAIRVCINQFFDSLAEKKADTTTPTIQAVIHASPTLEPFR